MSKNRFLRLDRLMASSTLDAIVLNPGPTLTYLTGLEFHLMERPVLLIYKPGDPPVLILPELETAKLTQLTFPVTVFTFGDDPADWQKVFAHALESMSGRQMTFGVEPTRLRFLEMDILQKAVSQGTFVPSPAVIGGLRLQKDGGEIASMRKAVQIAQTALHATLPCIKPGISEQEIVSELVIQLYKAGSSSELPFAPIVASGPNSANPHPTPTSRRLKRGDLLVIDWGAGYDNLFSDLTRTFGISELEPDLVKIYETVLSANTAGRKTGKPGLNAGEVDAAARTVIENTGFGKFFIHRTGHGLGMEAHEEPYIFSGNQLPLAEGMVYTVEPGIYLPGKGGIRIEDDVVITLTGCESLSDFPRDLQIL